MHRIATFVLAAITSAQFGTIQIDWTNPQAPEVVGLEHEGPHPHEPIPPEDRRAGTPGLAKKKYLLLVERNLVAALANDNDPQATAALWEHWFGERGEVARESIRVANGALDDPAAAGENSLLQLMVDFPDWAEPINRLATLRFMQGRFEESVTLCERVLALKPWHFGALSGIVMCHTKLRAVEEANRWAAVSMPAVGTVQRYEWVGQAFRAIDSRYAALANDASSAEERRFRTRVSE